MHSFLVAFAYLMMVFAPCAVAQWGDVLIDWRIRLDAAFSRQKGLRRDPMLASLRSQHAATRAVAAVEMLAEAAFIDSRPQPLFAERAFFRPRARFATAEEAAMAALTPLRDSAFETAAARVTARLAQMAHAHRLANAPMDAAVLPVVAERVAKPSRTFYGDDVPSFIPDFIETKTSRPDPDVRVTVIDVPPLLAPAAAMDGPAFAFAAVPEEALPGKITEMPMPAVRKPPVRAHEHDPAILQPAALTPELARLMHLIGEPQTARVESISRPAISIDAAERQTPSVAEEIAA